MTTTPHLRIDLLTVNQSKKEITTNEALIKVDALLNTCAIAITSTPPTSPISGDVYIVGNNAINDWLGKDNHIAYFYVNAWQFINPNEGALLWLKSASKLYVFSLGNWIEI